MRRPQVETEGVARGSQHGFQTVGDDDGSPSVIGSSRNRFEDELTRSPRHKDKCERPLRGASREGENA
jgi:hypothetical protein